MDEATVQRVLADPVSQRLLKTCPITRLAYTAPDGTPRVVPIGYSLRGDAFLMHTAPNSQKVAALRQRPETAMTIDTDAFPPNVLLVRGTASLEEVEGVPAEYLEDSRRVMDAAQFESFEASVRQLYERMVRIMVTPTWAKVLDFDTRLPSAVQELAERA
jgi:hypothetical protein